MTKRSRAFDRGRGYYLSLVMGLVLIASNAAAATFALSAPPPFGNQIVNTTSAPQNAVVTNTGKSVLVFTATTTGDFHTTGSSCNGSVPVGGACNVFITFRPTAAGARTGTLVVTDTTKASNKMTVSLSGAGVAEITATPSSLAFGNIARGSGASLNVTLQNNLATSLTSVALTTAAPYSAAGCSGSVAPGGSCVITVTFAPTTQAGVVNSSLTITAPPASTPATVTLAGTAVVPLTVSPNPLDFGNVAVTVTSAPKSVTLANNTGAQVTLGTPVATLGGDAKNDYAVTSTTCGKKLNIGATCAVSVTFHPTIGGSRAATLLINNSALATPQAANLIGIGTNPLTVSPALNLGSVDVASTSTSQTASVKNNQTVAVIFSSITAGADFAVQPAGTTCSTAAPLAAGATCVIAVVMTPTIGGPRAGLLTIVSDAYGSPSTTTLSGVGTNPVVATPSTLSFGNVTVASTSAGQTVTVTNRQSVAATLQGASFTFTGTAAADYGVTSTTCPAPPAALAAGANCTATIAFTPRVGGARSASLSVNDTAFGNPRLVSLTGVGTTPITITPSQVPFGAVDVGLESAPQQITLKNNQSVPVNFSSVVPSGDFALYAPGTTCGTVLAATAQCVIAVTMRPTIAGPRTGTLTINSDTSETPNTVGLAGSGTNGVTASTTSLTFASQAVNTTSAPQTVTLTNHQTIAAALGTIVTGDFAASDNCGGTIPANTSCVVSITFAPTALGTRTGSATFNNPGSAPTVVSLTGTAISATLPAIESVTPGTGTIGTTILGVVVTGNGSTNFDSTSLVDFGAGTSTSNLRGVSAGSLTVDVAIAANATPGTRTVTVTTGTETASLDSGFLVTASSSVSLATVTPDSGKQGQTLDVAIVGAGTHFQQGVTFANFGQGVAVNTLTVADQTNATANVTVTPTTAALGWRAVTLTTGGEQARLTPANPPVTGPGFNVLRGDAALTSVTPNTGVQGAPAFQVTIAGSATHFATGQTQVSFGQGILVGAIQVATPTTLSVQITVTSGAVPGDRDVAVTTDGEVATLANAFTVMAAGTPAITGVAPTEAAQGDSLSLTITAVNTTFTTDMPGPTLTLGSNILVSDLMVLNDTTVTANLQIEPVASTGDRTGTLSSGGTNLPFSFRVQSSNASIASVSPSNGPQGATIDVTVTGQGTHWQQGVTTASFTSTLCPLPVKAVTVTSETTAILNLEIPANACAGPQPFQIATGGEIVGSSFAVYRQTPSVTVTPSTGMAGTTLTVNVLGEFSKFANGSTTATISGAGVSIQNFVVTSPTSASAKFVIAPNALTGACYPEANSGCHIVTLTTPLGDGAFEILSANFQVTSTPATLTLIDPFHASPGTSTTVTIRGSNTNFAQGSTTVGFGPDITTSGLTIASPTELTVDVSVGADAARGWRSAFVNTSAEQLTIGFRVDTADAPAIAAIAPASGSQGESGITVTISGANTNFNDSSEVIVGAGVSVFGAQVLSPTQITASIAISPTAPVGPNTVFVLTTVGSTQEIASGAGFSVLRGPALLQSVTPGAAAQNDVLSVSLVGVGTHWLQGATAADFGSGISVAQLTVSDATHATAQLIVLSTAALGSRTVSVVTDGERVFQDQAFVVEPGTPVLLNSSPNSGQQGTTFTVQTLGLFTNWQQDVTTAAYGNGVTASVTVISPTSASIEVTIDPLAFVDTSGSCRTLTITTGTEQVSLPNQLCVQPGAAVLTSVVPNAAPQSSTVTVTITGQNTHFVAGVTTADFGQGIGTSNVTVNSATSASVDVAVTTGAATGFRTATLRTSGETASLGNAFIVRPTTPTLNGASPVSGQQGQSLTVHLIGQYTNWSQGTTTVTFGEGITVGNVIVSNATTLDATITIGSLALVGGRTVTVTTGGEVVSANVFGVVASGAIITQATPQSGNQGQDIVLTITGQNTHWEQGLTQFAMSGAGGDITINYVLINGSTSATAGITISPTATLGARSIYMVTGAEAVIDAGAFVVTGGIPAIASISPGNARAGDVAVNVQIAGLYTRWLTGTTTVDFGPGITVNAVLVNNDTSITAVVDVASAASVGGRTVVVRNTTGTSTQALIGYFDVLSNTPPRPFISYLSPSSALRGQTFTITMSGQYTHWDPAPGATRLDFGDPTASGITINTFQVTSPTSARANITIASDATLGSRVLSIETDTPSGAEVVQATFSVVQETPTLTIVDPSAGMQGATLTVNIIGQYTGFNPSTTFNFGSGITVNDVEVLGPNVAQVNITIGQLAIFGQRFVTATTDGRLVGGVAFTVTPSQAVIVSLSPNTAKQGNSVEATVRGENTNWSPATTFTLGSGIDVTNVDVIDATHATLTLSVQALAAIGVHSITATTGGEVASLANAFVVQPGTPLILSGGASAPQQSAVTFTILGQATQWVNGSTTVSFGADVQITSTSVTSPTAITVTGIVYWGALGYRTLTVTTGSDVLTMPNAFVITPGPAAIAQLSPVSAGQGVTLNIDVTGVNTHFIQGATAATLGSDIQVNSVAVSTPTSATVNVTTTQNAAPGQRTVILTTEAETAAIVNGFTVQLTTPSLLFVYPPSGAQGEARDVTVIGSLTTFSQATTFDFGPGVAATTKTITDATHATVGLSVSPVAFRSIRDVTATTNGVTTIGASLFSVTTGPAYISAVAPVGGRQDQTNLQISISGFATHFTAALPTVNLGTGVTVTNVQVISDTELVATVDISISAPAQMNDVVVQTLGEVAVLPKGFAVQPIVPVTPVLAWNTPAAITYGTALGASQLNASATAPGSPAPLAGSFAYSPSSGTYLHAGPAQPLTVVFTPSDSVRYTTATLTVYIDVNRVTLLVSADDKTKIVGTPNPALTYTVSGFVLGDTIAVVSGTPVLSTTAVTSSPAGTYPITASAGSLSAADYDFSFAAGTLTVSGATDAPVIGGFDSARASGLGLVDGSGLSAFRTDLATLMPSARLAATATLTDAFLAGVDVALLSSPTGNGSSVTALSSSEQLALHNFVAGGGGAVIIVDNDSFVGGAAAVNNSFLSPFGMHVTGTDATYTSAATISNPSASPITSGPFGSVSSLNLVFPGWFDTLGPATSLGTLNVNGMPFLAVIPRDALAPGSGAVVFVSDEDIANEWWTPNPEYRTLILNAISYARAVPLADFETGTLNGWTLTGGPWTVGGTTNTSPNLMPIDGTMFARSGAPNVSSGNPLAESNVGTATSPAFQVTGDTLSWYATGWSGPSYDARSYFQVLDAQLVERARIPVPQSDTWVQLTTNLVADGFAPGDTFYFRAVDGDNENNYAWLAFDKLTLRNSPPVKATPTITWATPADIVYGTPLGAVQLNATANVSGTSVSGTFVYSPAAGIVLSAGLAQSLNVTFTPDDSVHYEVATATVYINVLRAPQATLLVSVPPGSGVYNVPFGVGTTGGTGQGGVTFAVTGDCTNTNGGSQITMTTGTGACSIIATKAGDANFLQATSAAVQVTAAKASQATLTVIAPESAPSGTTFTASTSGGSTAATVTFAVSGACTNTNGGADITLNSSSSACSIVATKPGDANYLEAISAPAVVAVGAEATPTLDVVESSAVVGVCPSGVQGCGGGAVTPASVNVRLQRNGVSVIAPAGGVPLTITSSNPQCVSAPATGSIAPGTFVTSVSVTYGNSASLSCNATVTVANETYGSDTIAVVVARYDQLSANRAVGALSYFNPAPVPNPAGALATKVTGISYFNPAPVPNPTGALTTKVASLSYYNPATIPNPGGARATQVAAVSFFNPAPVPNPSGTLASKVTALTYYNPASVPMGNGMLFTGIAAVSFCNGADSVYPQFCPEQLAPAQDLSAQLRAGTTADATPTALTASISVANGPAATSVRPVRLSRTPGTSYTLTIRGANLIGATEVTFVGIWNGDVVSGSPVVSADGRTLTVDVFVSPNAPLGAVNVVVGGPGWRTAEVPGMRVEIVR